MAEGVGAEAHEGVVDGNVELHGDHAGRLVDGEPEVRAGLEIRPDRPEEAPDCISMIDRPTTSARTRASACWSAVSGPGAFAIEVQRAEAGPPGDDGEPEHGARSGGDGRFAEQRPAIDRRVGEIRLDDGTVLEVGIHARPLTQRELQLLDERADLVGAAHRPTRSLVVDQHDAGARQLGDLGADDAQPGRRPVGGTIRDVREDAEQPLVSHAGSGDRCGPRRSGAGVWSFLAASDQGRRQTRTRPEREPNGGYPSCPRSPALPH